MKYNLKKIANPYSAFSISWFSCLGLYSLGWSNLFPRISLSLFVFLFFFIVVFAVAGLFFDKVPFTKPELLKIGNKRLLVINVILYSLNFLYSGIPLVNGTRDMDFGVPTVIVLTTSLNCFVSIYFFYAFLNTRKKILLLYILICFGLFILSFSRGNIIMSVVSMFFVWINITLPQLDLKKIVGIVAGALIMLYVFGLAGNYRLINEVRKGNPEADPTYNSELILNLGQASESFKDNVVPDEFFWGFLYATSPLSNLQYNINKYPSSLTISGLGFVFIDEFLFDSLSKRINDILGRKRAVADVIVDDLAVTTTLTGSYNYAGWIGMVFLLFLFLLFPLIYSIVVSKNPVGILGISILCTIYFFSIFDNMLTTTGLSFQILYPIIFNFIAKLKIYND
ncbi:oligosaccharide repeat unit polymerase [Mucilaginibacter myungsuensis]|uniref:Oligosaccharide repeat unit polymerase n=1 Tax=Mucilaginibacter myungsuensis TaxID=649104 RepID=A0A929PYR8_9SPHI|nr:oligosaccharide repeat unit polymerase [Mucilaginibacter myungsuensis]MBE9663740.1 oligosaccharide repeat unit polymerase [Mucilaginibacter myungsuensis]MDN3598936.1 oligosaccharide repeat unit polymerase [Mucilaginibacter myungsuensis]